MKPTRSFLQFLVLTIWNKLYGIACISNNVRFNRGKFLDGNFCPDGNVIQNTSYVSTIECLTLCSTHSQCHGVFLEPEAMRCVTCSAMYYIIKSESTASMFYKRQAATGVSAYRLVTQPKTWYTAKQYCESIGGQMLILTSKKENDFIVQYLQTVETTGGILLGGKGTGGRAHTFKWVDGSRVSDGYTNWRRNEPYPTSRNYVQYIRMVRGDWNFQWNDDDDASLHSICKFE